ncbi:hypothetical protein HDU92_007110, partial [Lobulomyces angularis]
KCFKKLRNRQQLNGHLKTICVPEINSSESLNSTSSPKPSKKLSKDTSTVAEKKEKSSLFNVKNLVLTPALPSPNIITSIPKTIDALNSVDMKNIATTSKEIIVDTAKQVPIDGPPPDYESVFNSQRNSFKSNKRDFSTMCSEINESSKTRYLKTFVDNADSEEKDFQRRESLNISVYPPLASDVNNSKFRCKDRYDESNFSEVSRSDSLLTSSHNDDSAVVLASPSMSHSRNSVNDEEYVEILPITVTKNQSYQQEYNLLLLW